MLCACRAQYKRTVGGKEVCADGNAEDNFDTPPAGGWGFHDNGKEKSRVSLSGRHSDDKSTWSSSTCRTPLNFVLRRAHTLTTSLLAGSFDKVQCTQKADGTTDVFCGSDGYFKATGTSSLAFSG